MKWFVPDKISNISNPRPIGDCILLRKIKRRLYPQMLKLTVWKLNVDACLGSRTDATHAKLLSESF